MSVGGLILDDAVGNTKVGAARCSVPLVQNGTASVLCRETERTPSDEGCLTNPVICR